ncbi:MAG: hypothetical protein WCX97_01275 [Candidatus Magasanikbacteria bacterium]
MSGRIIEAGHYYQIHGPTQLSRDGWEIIKKIKETQDDTMLFIDDYHPKSMVPKQELEYPTIAFNPKTDHIVFESNLMAEASEVLERLKQLPRRHRARETDRGWFCSGFALTDGADKPKCVLLDAGLILRKLSLGYKQGVNILPFFYEEEQNHLIRLIKKVIPEFKLEVILF